jgi:hypothetical protein
MLSFGIVISGPLNTEGYEPAPSTRAVTTRIDSHLVHIVPDVDSIGALCPRPATFELLCFEELRPPIPRRRVEEVGPGATARPAPALVLSLPSFRLDEEATLRSFLVYRVI